MRVPNRPRRSIPAPYEQRRGHGVGLTETPRKARVIHFESEGMVRIRAHKRQAADHYPAVIILLECRGRWTEAHTEFRDWAPCSPKVLELAIEIVAPTSTRYHESASKRG